MRAEIVQSAQSLGHGLDDRGTEVRLSACGRDFSAIESPEVILYRLHWHSPPPRSPRFDLFFLKSEHFL